MDAAAVGDRVAAWAPSGTPSVSATSAWCCSTPACRHRRLDLGRPDPRAGRAVPIRILLLTSGDRPGDPARSRELRIDAHLLKPVRQDELLGDDLPGNEPGQGSPMAVAGPGEKPARYRSRPRRPLNILGGEDNGISAQLRSTTRPARHRMRLARQRREALALAGEGIFDLLLLDVHMPGTGRIRGRRGDSGAGADRGGTSARHCPDRAFEGRRTASAARRPAWTIS